MNKTEKRNRILIAVMENELIQSAIRNICPHMLRDDFTQHFYIQLLEMREDKLIAAWEGGYIEWLCVRILSNQMGNRSSFWKMFRNSGNPSTEKKVFGEDWGFQTNFWDKERLEVGLQYKIPIDDSEENIERLIELEIKRDTVILALNSRHYYHRHLYLLHLDGMTYKDIHRETGISYQSVRLSILATTEWLKNNITNNGKNSD